MPSRQLDLVHELQVELAWDPDFAAGAYREYKRWLHLRVQAGDFLNCKLPPSRVVSLVWAMHRNWTHDYEKTCTDLGGFIHHYPPAMRMNMAREQAYAATVHVYRNTYKEDPPSAYWGAAFCPYKPLTADVEMVDEEDAVADVNPPPRVTPSSRRTSARRDSTQVRTPATAKPKEKIATEPPARRSYSKRVYTEEEARTPEKPRTSPADESRARRTAKALKESKASQSKADEAGTSSEAQQRATKAKGRRRLSGSSQMYILKPLRPGEKRKRGRPSFSDYVLVSDVNKTGPSSDSKKKDSKTSTPEKASGSKSVERSAPPTLRRRRSLSSPTKTASPTPVITKTQKGQKVLRRIARSAVGAVAGGTAGGPKSGASSAAAPSKPSSDGGATQEGKDSVVPPKRPRGRPRKDGSWPVPRVRPTESSAQKQTASQKNEARGEGKGTKAGKATQSQKEGGTTGSNKEGKGPQSSTVAAKAKESTPKLPSDANEDTPSKIIQGGDVQMQDLTVKPAQSKTRAARESASREAAVKQTAPESASTPKKANNNDSNTGAADKVAAEVTNPAGDSLEEAVEGGTGVDVAGNTQATGPLVSTTIAPTVIGSGALASSPAMSGAMGTAGLGSGAMANVSMGISAGYSAQEIASSQDNGFQMGQLKAVPIAPAPVVSGVPTLPTMPAMPAMPPISTVPTGPTVPPMPPVPGLNDAAMLPVGPSMGGKLGLGTTMSGAEAHEDGEGKRPFRRPRGRPRRDSQWSAARKPVSDEAVERVKDLNDPATQLNFPMGPSGTV